MRGNCLRKSGYAYEMLGNFQKSIECHELSINIAKELEHRRGEGAAYNNLSSTYQSLGDSAKAIDYAQRALNLSKELGDDSMESKALHRLGRSLELQGSYGEAIDCFRSSLRKLSNLRNRLQFNDEWKVSFSHVHSSPYRSLYCLLLKQGKVIEALSIAEAARAQALKDLLRFKYNCSETEAGTPSTEEKCEETRLTHFRSNIIFMEVDLEDITFWVIQNGEVTVHKKKTDYYGLSMQRNTVG